MFQVDYNPTTHTATWTYIDNGLGPLGDLPVTGIARDAQTGTLYVSTDFTVLADSPALERHVRRQLAAGREAHCRRSRSRV